MTWEKVSGDISETWTFDEDNHQILEGELISKSQVKTKYREAQRRYVIQDKAGVPWTVWSTTVLDRALADIKEGDKIQIEYLGVERNFKTGNQYKAFNVSLWKK